MKSFCVLVGATAGLLLVSLGLLAQESKKPAAAKTTTSESGPVTAGGVQVLKIAICRDVKDRDPQEELTTAKVGDTVAGWSQIKAAADTTITHRWILDGKTVKDIPLQVKGSSAYRAWSKKTVAHPGNWKFQVVDSEGNVLKEVAFTAS